MMRLTPDSNNSPTSSLMDGVLVVRDTLNQDIVQAPVLVGGDLSQAFALLDPDLAMLHKDMQSALAQYEMARKNGQMIDMTKWRFESAESAYQTRLMEVRQNKLARETAELAIDKGEQEAKKQLHIQSMQDRMNEQFNATRRKKIEEKRRKEEKQGGFFFYFLLGMWLAQIQAQQRAKNLELSNVQNAFFNAHTS